LNRNEIYGCIVRRHTPGRIRLLRQTPEGFTIPEFLPPVGRAGKYSGIIINGKSCRISNTFNKKEETHDTGYYHRRRIFPPPDAAGETGAILPGHGDCRRM
jgi:hypothetical protein